VASIASLHQDTDRAADAIERRLRLDLNDAAAHLDLAAVYTKQDRLDEAFAELAIAARLNPDNPLTFVFLGRNHTAQRRHADAVEALQHAVTLMPEMQGGQYEFAQALIRVGRRNEARQHLSEFQRLRTEGMEREQRNEQIRQMKRAAIQQSRDGHDARAAEIWMQVIPLEPEVTQNYVDVADALVKAGRTEESLAYLIEAADRDGVAEVHLRIADVLDRLGRSQEAGLARAIYERLRLEDAQRRLRR
jgi:tetratricopeptide (TPR) repeat protein